MRLEREFYFRDVLEVAPELVGKILVHRMANGSEMRLRISETEAYRGESDTACHAHRGKTARTEVLYRQAGTVYVYLCYGMHWLLNFVTGETGEAQAVLIRACEGYTGPGKLTKAMGITGELNRSDACTSEEIWVEDDGRRFSVSADTRVGIKYASPEDQARLWRFKLIGEENDSRV